MRPNIALKLVIALCLSTAQSSTLSPLKSFCRDRTGPTTRCFALYHAPATWSDAMTTCSEVNMAMAVIDSREVQRDISSNFVALSDPEFAREGTQQAWVAAARGGTGGAWRWTNGSPKGEDAVLESTKEGDNCVVVQFTPPRALVLSSRACNYVYIDLHICAYFGQDCRDIGAPDYSQTLGGGICIAAYKEYVTWFEARQRCNDRGGDLVSLTDDVTRDVLWSFLRGMTLEGKWRAWIGLNRHSWSWIYANGSRSRMPFYNWVPGETFDADCVSVDLSATGNGAWRSKACSGATLPFHICENSTNHATLAPPAPPHTTTLAGSRPTLILPTSAEINYTETSSAISTGGLSTYYLVLIIAMIATFALALIIAMAVIVCCPHKRCRKQNVTHEPPHSE